MSFSLKSLCSNVLPAGTYKVVVEDVKLKVGEGGVKTSDLQVFYRVTDGVNKGKGLVETISENTFSWKLSPFLQATGLDMNREFSTKDEMMDYIVKAAKGAVIMAEVVIKQYNGNDLNNIKSYSPLPGSSTTTEDVLADLNIEPIKGEKPHIDDLPTSPEASDADIIEPIIDTEKLF